LSEKLLKKSICVVVIVARTLTVRSVRLAFSLLDASPLELFQQFLNPPLPSASPISGFSTVKLDSFIVILYLFRIIII